jgi:hypothetical protein
MTPVLLPIGPRAPIVRRAGASVMGVVLAGISMVPVVVLAAADRLMGLVVANATTVAAAMEVAARLESLANDPMIAVRVMTGEALANVTAATSGMAVSARATGAGTTGSIRRSEMQQVGRMAIVMPEPIRMGTHLATSGAGGATARPRHSTGLPS